MPSTLEQNNAQASGKATAVKIFILSEQAQ
jgi:hypothetical protein